MDNELTPEERTALGALGAELRPPDGLEDHVVDALRDAPLIVDARPTRRYWRHAAAAAVIAVVAFAAGNRYDATVAPEPQGTRYLLILLEPAGVTLPAAQEAARTAEYGAWANALAGEGKLLAGEKLADASDIVGGVAPVGTAPERVTGFFIVVADSRQQALDLARDCPHARHGMRVEVREIETT